MYPDLSWKEPSGMLANLVADSGAGKGQLSSIVEAVCSVDRSLFMTSKDVPEVVFIHFFV